MSDYYREPKSGNAMTADGTKRSATKLRLWFVGAAVVMFSGGLWTGSYYSRLHAEDRRLDQLGLLLEKQLRNVKVGEPFPDFMVRSLDGSGSPYTSELLPDGGIVFLFTGDSSLLRQVVAGLSEGLGEETTGRVPAVVLTAGEEYQFLHAEMSRLKVYLPVYVDDADWLRTGCDVPVGLVHFELNHRHEVLALAPTGAGAQRFRTLLR